MAGKENYSKCADTPPEEFIQFVRKKILFIVE